VYQETRLAFFPDAVFLIVVYFTEIEIKPVLWGIVGGGRGITSVIIGVLAVFRPCEKYRCNI
tara:strand:+ start:339 stop:524 length:186 start_codon:yes stop_codon:yes gene_type:complete